MHAHLTAAWREGSTITVLEVWQASTVVAIVCQASTITVLKVWQASTADAIVCQASTAVAIVWQASTAVECSTCRVLSSRHSWL